MGFVIDTCIWVDVERGALAPADVATISGDEPVYLSPVTIAELKFGAEIAKTPEVRQKRVRHRTTFCVQRARGIH